MGLKKPLFGYKPDQSQSHEHLKSGSIINCAAVTWKRTSSPSHPHPTGNIMWAVNIWRNMVRLGGVCRNLHRKASQLYILLFLFGGQIMDITGKPDWCPDMFGYPKESEVENPHLYSVLASLKRENQRCFQFSPFPKYMMMEHGKYFY